MSDTVISVENLSKLYLLGKAERRHESLLAELGGLLSAPFRNFRELRRLDTSRAAVSEQESPDLLWALKDVSFEVKRGEVLGIIGRNGAGKSTLLKLLSRITEPTKGRVRIRGRVASLLEVGTGFHQDLTGRENIYLNGTILGMKRREIDRQFDEIVDFSGVERFLDTPVKRYSSGMKVRLGFAVAAHLAPENMIVDEVLAVGDSEFQKKCIGKMQEIVKSSGRTILFVSHNHSTLESLCTRGILLRQGQLIEEGPISAVIDSYLKGIEKQASEDVAHRADRVGDGMWRFQSIKAEGVDGAALLATGRPARFTFSLDQPATRAACTFTIYNHRGVAITCLTTNSECPDDRLAPDGQPLSRFVCEVDELPLLPGRYRINAGLWVGGDLQDHLDGAVFFDVEAGRMRGRPVLTQTHFGDIHIAHRWFEDSNLAVGSGWPK